MLRLVMFKEWLGAMQACLLGIEVVKNRLNIDDFCSTIRDSLGKWALSAVRNKWYGHDHT